MRDIKCKGLVMPVNDFLRIVALLLSNNRKRTIVIPCISTVAGNPAKEF